MDQRDDSQTRPGEGLKAEEAGSLPIMVVGWLFLAWSCFAGWKSVRHAALLSSRGQPAIARVTEYTPRKAYHRRGSYTVHYHSAEYDGHSGKVKLKKKHPVGDVIPVLYLPDSPHVVMAGQVGQTFTGLFMTEIGIVGGLSLVLMSLCLVCVTGCLLADGVRHARHWTREESPRP